MRRYSVLMALGFGVLGPGCELVLGQAIDLPTSKQIVRPVPGGPQRIE